MKNLFVVCFAMLAFAACKDDEGGYGFGACIEAKLKDFKSQPHAKSIRIQALNGETQFWLNGGTGEFDPQYILNEHCDTVCHYCDACSLTACLAPFDFQNWEIIWEK